MISSLDQQIGRVTGLWIDFIRPHARSVISCFVVAAVACTAYSAAHLRLNSDEEAIFGEDIPFVRLRDEFRRALPNLINPIVVVVDGASFDLAEDAATRLAARLRQQPGLFRDVYQPGGGPFFEAHGLLYLSPDELQELTDNLARAQPYLAELSKDRSLRGFLSLLAEATSAIGEAGLNPSHLVALFERTSETFEAQLRGKRHQLSWAELMLGEEFAQEGRRRFVLVQPVVDFSRPSPAHEALVGLRQDVADLGLEGNGVQVRLTGTWLLSAEEAQHVGQQSTVVGVAAFILVTAVLVSGMGSLRLVAASLITLLVGLALTAGFAALAVGHLNLISVTFAVLFIALSIDFAIHVCIRYRELLRLDRSLPDALRTTAQDIGGSLAICALTTAIGFFAFLTTNYRGVAELGLIAGAGMLISLFTSLTLLPALLVQIARPQNMKLRELRPSRAAKLLTIPVRHAAAVCGGTSVLAVGALMLLPQIEFDLNPLRMRDPTTESVRTFDELLAEGKAFPWNVNVIRSDLAGADAVAARIERLEAVERTVTLSDFVPENQDEKLAILADTALLLGPALDPPEPGEPPSTPEQLAALNSLERDLAALDPRRGPAELGKAALRLRHALEAFQRQGLAEPALVEPALASLEQDLLGSLDQRLRTLRSALSARPLRLEDLPQDVKNAMVAVDGRMRVEIFPQEDLNDNEALERYVEEVRSLAPDAFGEGLVILESGRTVVRAFRQALLTAALLIVGLLLLVWRNLTDAALVAIPLVLAAVFTAAAAVLLGIPFNFANVIVIPLLLGMGVDSSIHLVHRFRSAALPGGNLLQTSTARAVLLSALTTIASFGALGLSTHLGMASLGQLLTLGITLILVCSLLVLPALIGFLQSRRNA